MRVLFTFLAFVFCSLTYSQNLIHLDSIVTFSEQGEHKFSGIVKDTVGNLFISRRRDEGVFSPFSIYKTNYNLELDWIAEVGSSNQAYYQARGILPDQQGGCYVYYSFNGNIILLRIDNQGTTVWQKSIWSNGYDQFLSMAMKSDSSLLISVSLDAWNGTFAEDSIYHSYAYPGTGEPSLMAAFVIAEINIENGETITSHAPFNTSFEGFVPLALSPIFVLSNGEYVVISHITYLNENPLPGYLCDRQTSLVYMRFSEDHELVSSICLGDLQLPNCSELISGIYSNQLINDTLFCMNRSGCSEYNEYRRIKLFLPTGEYTTELVNSLTPVPLFYLQHDDQINWYSFINAATSLCEGFGIQIEEANHTPISQFCFPGAGINTSSLVSINDSTFYGTYLGDVNGIVRLRLQSTIFGQLFFDSNNNQVKDGNEFPIYGGQVSISHNDSTWETNVYNGIYSQPADEGEYILSPQTVVELSCLPVYDTVQVSNSEFELIQKDFACRPISEFSDLRVILVPEILVAGFPWVVKAYVSNVGPLAAPGIFTLNIPNETTLVSCNRLYTLTNEIFECNLSTIQPFETKEIILHLETEPPPALLPFDSDTLNAQITINDTDLFPENNSCQNVVTVFSSYDPNDITHTRGRLIKNSSIEAGDSFIYLIRFQNEGNYPTSFIRIKDTLSDDFMLSSAKLISSSHQPLQFTLAPNGELDFYYPSINLSPKAEDEELSKGWLLFEVKPSPNLATGDIVTNKADIYFDFNPAIVTPIDSVWIGEFTALESIHTIPLKIMPNPANDYVNVSLEKMIIKPSTLRIIDISGSEKYKETVNPGMSLIHISLSDFNSGVYFIQFTGPDAEIVGTEKLCIIRK
jgi:hypothetical protein